MFPQRLVTILWGVCLMGSALPAHALEPSRRDLEYAQVEGHRLRLDLYLPPETAKRTPVIVWVHGGAWRAGSKDAVPITELVNQGFAIASVEYRLSPVAPFPAQVHDIKAAIRWLRHHAAAHQLDPDRVVIAGSSAGGHLAALVGLSNGVAELEGTVGEHRDVSSDVQGVVSWFGAANLTTILGQSTEHGLSVRVPALQLLLRGQPDERPELARLASPVSHVDAKDPPLLLIHGDADPQMPIAQSYELLRAYQKARNQVELVIVPGGVHGGRGFFEPERLTQVVAFINHKVLRR